MSNHVSNLPPRTAALLTLILAACAEKVPPTYRTEPVTRGDVVESVSATGEVGALMTVSVGSQVSGTVLRLHADFNTLVRKGQLVAELDPRLFLAALARAEAGLAAADADVEKAKVSLADAQRTADRTASLLEKKLVSQQDLDTAIALRDGARASVKAVQARVMQARAERDTAATNVSLCRIKSPIDGIVISRNVDVGQTVAATMQAPVLFTIANDLTRMQILANVDEADIGKVTRGLESRFTVDAFPGETFKGAIREVRAAPTTIQNVVTYAAVLDAPNPERKLRQGMTASVTIITARHEGVLRLPNAALRFKPAEGQINAQRAAPKEGRPAGPKRQETSATTAEETKPRARTATVYRLDAGALVPVEVTLGLADGHQTEVLAGLSEGDGVVVGDGNARTGGAGAPGGPRRGLF